MDRFHHYLAKRSSAWFDDALSRLSQANSKQAIGDRLYEITNADGFRNMVLTEIREGQIMDVSWTRFPHGFADTYIAHDWTECDPVLKRAKTASSVIVWSEVLKDSALSAAEHEMMKAAAALGVHSGYTIPFHGPNNTVHLLSISMRETCAMPQPARMNQLTALALFCLSRLSEFDQRTTEQAVAQALLSASSGKALPLEGDPDSPFVLTHAHLRELVLIEVGVRRWQMGLTGLGTKIFKSRSKREIADLERWGLVVETPDDERWCFHLAPSVLGWSYLRNRTEVEWLRRHIWEHEIPRNEVPDQAGIS